MIVLHAGFADDRLLFWGETPAGGEAPSGGRSCRKRNPLTPKSLPYDAGARRLRAALAEVGVAGKSRTARTVKATAWLPTARARPVASSPLIAEPPARCTKTKISPYRIVVVSVPVERAVETLCACAGRETLAPGVVVGSDLAFWATACRFAGSLVARQRFLPGLLEMNGSYRALWEPVFAGRDPETLARLASAMPASARAVGVGSTTPPEMPARDALSEFVKLIVDQLVRSDLTRGLGAGGPGRGKKRPRFDSIHDQWLHALRSPDGLMAGNRNELDALASQLREWRRPVSVSVSTPFRLCFRLEEPEAPDDGAMGIRAPRGPWKVRFLLQAADDPSLLVPAKLAWNGRGRRVSALRRNGFDAREYLLVALGEASRIDRRIEASLKTAAPSGYELDATGAHEFMTEKSLMIEQAGFGVMLPAWWTRKGTKLRLSARANVKSPKMQGGSGLSLEDMVQFDWELALGGEKLSLKELRALAKLKAPLVRARGQWVEVNADDIRAALEFWKKRSDKATVGEVVKMALGVTPAPAGPEVVGVKASGWIADFLSQLEGRSQFEELPAPEGFRGTLRPYQVRGFSWLAFLRRWGLGACLADDMGLGKTVQTLVLIQREWSMDGKRPASPGRSPALPRRSPAIKSGPQRTGLNRPASPGRSPALLRRSPVLLVCPTSVVENWRKEAERFTPGLPVMVHHGISRRKGATFKRAARRQAVVVTSYALLHRDLDVLKGIRWGGIVLDEAQNVKNPETKQSKAARSLRADYRLALTGTPVENNVGDLWSIMEFLNPGFLGTQAEFKRSFFVPIQAERDPDAVLRLKRLTGPFVLRRLKTDRSVISDLPEKMEMKVFCTLTKEQASLYEAVAEEAAEALEETEGIKRKGVVLATLSKLKQVCNHPAQFLGDNSAVPGRSGKLARLVEMLVEIHETGEGALVFSQFSEMGGIIKRRLEDVFGREVLFLHGGVPRKNRDRMVERFQSANGHARVFVLSLKAGGTGLNLTRANHVFHFDRWWNPAVENQATDRAFRIGQTKNVQVHKFVCAGTLEEKIDEMIESKRQVAESVVGTGEAWLTELSTGELRDIFALRKEAVAE